MSDSPSIIELRQYTLHPGHRDALIALFEREFIETQEALGMRLIGQFRDLDDPDRFVWVRGFVDMDSRRTALDAFYTGSAWVAHRDAANATMIDSDDVLMLRPLSPTEGFPFAERDPATLSEAVVIVGVHDRPGIIAGLDEIIHASLSAASLMPLAVLETEPAENSFPRLPVRTDGPYVAWVASAPSPAHADAALASLDFDGRLGPVRQRLRLSPTPRSRLRP